MKVAIIVQARMTSTRLPGKVLLPVRGKPLLEYQIERLRRVNLAATLVVATTVNDTDQPIVDLCDRLAVSVFRGDEADVLSRYYEAARACNADAIVRVTADCPLIDPHVIDTVIQQYLDQHPDIDYVSNTLQRTFPRGMDVEIFSIQMLTKAFQQATKSTDREHVTPFIYRQQDRCRITQVIHEVDQSKHRWTVDLQEDFELVQRMLETLSIQSPNFTLQDCLQLLSANPDWVYLNQHIEQKSY